MNYQGAPEFRFSGTLSVSPGGSPHHPMPRTKNPGPKQPKVVELKKVQGDNGDSSLLLQPLSSQA